FLFQEELRQLRLRDLEDQTEILPDQLVVLRHLVADRAEGASARHAKALLQTELRDEPLIEVVPRCDVVAERPAAVANRVEVRLQHLVNEAVLVLEVVIELALAGPRRLDDLVRARRRDALFVK